MNHENPKHDKNQKYQINVITFLFFLKTQNRTDNIEKFNVIKFRVNIKVKNY